MLDLSWISLDHGLYFLSFAEILVVILSLLIRHIVASSIFAARPSSLLTIWHYSTAMRTRR